MIFRGVFGSVGDGPVGAWCCCLLIRACVGVGWIENIYADETGIGIDRVLVDERAAGGALSPQFRDVCVGGEAVDAEAEDEGRDGSWGRADVLDGS